MISRVDLDVNYYKVGKTLHYPNKLKNIDGDYLTDSKGNKVTDSTVAELKIRDFVPHENPDRKTLGDVTSNFFNLYYFKYILVRVLVAVIVFVMLSAGIKIYMNLRRNKMVMTINEEATTTSIFLIDKYLKGSNTNNQYDRGKIIEILPQIISHLYTYSDGKNRSEVNKIIKSMKNIPRK